MPPDLQLRKYIYFPQSHAPNRAPRLIYVADTWGDSLKGSERAQELDEGRFAFFPARRCQPFSPALWEACMRWVTERDLVEARFEELMKKGVRYEGKTDSVFRPDGEGDPGGSQNTDSAGDQTPATTLDMESL